MSKQELKQSLLLSEFLTKKKEDYKKYYEDYDLRTFSSGITLQDYQKLCVKNALNALLFYIKDKEELLESFKKYNKNLEKNDIARASFWMATGSGKTIIMIKIITLINKLCNDNIIPKKSIMLLVPNDKILNQFKENIQKYNNHNSEFIKIKELKEWQNLKQEGLFNETMLYLARSDLLDNEENVGKDKKAKRLNYKDYINKNGWYILLDEAHKGDSKDSTRKKYYYELAKGILDDVNDFSKGFIFNFSATFDEEIDFLTCAYNYNLEKFNTQGYGKNIAILDNNLKAFKNDDEKEKIKIILESFIIFSAIKQSKEIFFEKVKDLNLKYHNPLIIVVSDKVNTKDAGIKMYFKTILSILKNQIDIKDIALNLSEKLKEQNLFFSNENLSDEFLKIIANTDNEILRKNIFYASLNANLECYKTNDKELLFASKNANKPFMLLNISNAKEWEKEFLLELGIESIKDISKSHFESINDENSTINIMLGSKVFSEGWDSNRVNLISFINIGSKNAKKYVLQTIGRGVRIEPFLNKRKRFIYNDLDYEIKEELKVFTSGLETLFVMASDNEAIKAILKSMDNFITNKALKGFRKNNVLNPLPVPKYKNNTLQSAIYKISTQEAKGLKEFIDSYDEDVLLLSHCAYKSFKYSTMKEINFFYENKSKRIKESGNKIEFNQKSTIRLINSVLNSFSKVLDKFDNLKDEINHYKNMQISLDDESVKELTQIIQELSVVKEIKTKEQLQKENVPEKYIDDILDFQKQKQEIIYKERYIISSKLQKHYYNPLVIYKKDDKNSKINFAISNESEKEFLDDLQEYLKNDSFLQNYEWCFSKLVENQDEIYIPYFDEEEQKERKFYPDFIFWLKDKISGDFNILFIDPKGLKVEANARYKANGFNNIFLNSILKYQDKNIKVKLIYYNKKGKYLVSNELKEFVKSSIEEIFN